MAILYRVRMTLAGWSGGPGLATHYFLEEASVEDTPEERAQEVADRVRAAWAPVATKMPSIWTANVQSAVDVLNAGTGALEASYAATAPSTLTGSESASFGPAAAGLCVNWNTADFVDGRRVRGRTFISPINLSGDANGTPTTAHVEKCQDMFPILSTHSTGYPRFAVWHRPVGGTGGSAHLVTGSTTRDTYSVLTSRR